MPLSVQVISHGANAIDVLTRTMVLSGTPHVPGCWELCPQGMPPDVYSAPGSGARHFCYFTHVVQEWLKEKGTPLCVACHCRKCAFPL
jgi:hypothetical protein